MASRCATFLTTRVTSCPAATSAPPKYDPSAPTPTTTKRIFWLRQLATAPFFRNHHVSASAKSLLGYDEDSDQGPGLNKGHESRRRTQIRAWTNTKTISASTQYPALIRRTALTGPCTIRQQGIRGTMPVGRTGVRCPLRRRGRRGSGQSTDGPWAAGSGRWPRS